MTIEPNSATSNNAAFAVDNVKLWSLKDPQRYLLTTTVTDAEGETIDTTTVKTGFRTTTFDATRVSHSMVRR